MADYFTQFSCALDMGTATNAARAIAMLDAMREKDDDPPYGFDAEIAPDDPGKIYMTDGGDQGDPEHVIRFVLACAAAFDLRGRWGFSWSLSCSKPRLDGFGGGAQLIDLTARKSIDWIDCEHWLTAVLAEGQPADPVPDSI